MTCHCECVLVVDDDHGAILLLRRAMKKAGVPHPVVEVHDGLAAVHYLKGTGPYADRLQHPCGRVGTPEDIAELAAFLLSPASGFVTGQNFVADGGMTKKMIYV